MPSLTNNAVVRYFREAKEELQKVTWPSREATLRYTVAVVIFCAVLAVYFGLLDWLLNKGLEALVSLTS